MHPTGVLFEGDCNLQYGVIFSRIQVKTKALPINYFSVLPARSFRIGLKMSLRERQMAKLFFGSAYMDLGLNW